MHDQANDGQLNEQASVRRLQMDDVTFTFVADGPNDLGHRSGSVAPAGVASAFFNIYVDTTVGVPLGLPQVLILCPQWATPQKAAIAMFVCLCTGATREVVAEAVATGARTSKQIAASCGAGADCGRCRRTVREIIASTCQAFATPALPLAVSC